MSRPGPPTRASGARAASTARGSSRSPRGTCTRASGTATGMRMCSRVFLRACVVRARTRGRAPNARSMLEQPSRHMHTHTPYRAHGKGVFRKKNGNTYEGEYKYDKCEGFGVYRFNNGDKYEGMWKNGLKTGQGTISWSNGRKFEGRFAHDCPIIGELTEADGKVYSVTYDGTQKFSKGAQPKSQELIRTDSPRPSEMKAAAAKLRQGTWQGAATRTPPYVSTAPARTAPALPTPPTSSAPAAGVAAAASEATAAGGAKASKADEWKPPADVAASVAEAATVPAGGKIVGDVWDPFGPAAAQDPFGLGPAAASSQAFNPFATPAGASFKGCVTLSEFERVRCDTEALQTKGGREQSPGTMGNSEVPDAFCCPIGLDIMSDPVFLIETGHTFERRLIEAHLQRSDRGPLCGVQLKSKTLMPNYALRQAIEAYLSDRGQAPGRIAPYPPIAPSPPTAGAVAGQ